MTTTYDPHHPLYLDEADVRTETTRVFDVCGSCRKCVSLCGAFPRLFELLDRDVDSGGRPDAGLMTPSEQDAVASECSQCKLCSIGCPNTIDSASGDRDVDMARLMLRATAMRVDVGLVSMRSKIASQVAGRTAGVGRIGSGAAPLANRVIEARPGSIVRRLAAKATGISATRVIAPYVKERFSTWFAQRPKILLGDANGKVTVFPTCVVEYHEPGLGKDLVKVYERNGIECNVSDANCCGAPWLQAGDVTKFAEIADKNTSQLASEVRSGTDVVVAQPSCAYVIKHDYPEYATTPERRAEATFVAEHSFDAAEYLMRFHRADGTVLDTGFEANAARSATYHMACHTRAQEFGLAARDLLQLTGARVRTVQGCAGANGVWAMSSDHEESSFAQASALGSDIAATQPTLVVGDCHRANTAIGGETGGAVAHPIQALARAYGIAEDH